MNLPSLSPLCLLLPVLLPCAARADGPQRFSSPPASTSTPARAEAAARMDALLQSFVDQQKVNCVTGFVATGGTVVYHRAFGWKDLEQHVPAEKDDYYVLFSQTKAVTSVAFMTLVERGLVAIDDPVAKYFPAIPDRVITAVHDDGTFESRPASRPMTFVDLLTHTSGLGSGLVRDLRRVRKAGSDAPLGFGGPVPAEAPAGQHTGGGNYSSRFLEEEMLALARYPLGHDPGSHWEYHVSSNMLGYLVERISGKPLREYVKETVLLPLGMTDTDWYYRPGARPRFVKPYRVLDGKLVPGSTVYADGSLSESQTYAEGAIGLNGPIEDYARFCQMLLNRGEFNGRRILKPETVDLMTTIDRLPRASGADKGFQFGLGFELHRGRKPVPAVSDSAFSWGGMFGTAYIVDPANDLVALFYLNMYGAEPLYPKFLEEAYRLAGETRESPPAAPSSPMAAMVVLENGGTGEFPAVVTEDPALPGMTLYRPRDLGPFGPARQLPVLLWGNGACANTTQEHKNFLNEIASRGYLVLGIGPLNQLEQRDATSRQATHSSQLLRALDWIQAQNASPTSAYAGKVDVAKVAAMGMSCGGLQAIEISGDPRIRTTVVCNSGILPTPSPRAGMPPLGKSELLKLHAPVLYLMGGPTDIAYANAMDDFARIQHVPVIMTNFDVGHGGTYSRPHGGEFTRVALAWLDWQLKDDADAGRMFLRDDSALRRDPKWTVELKNFDVRQPQK